MQLFVGEPTIEPLVVLEQSLNTIFIVNNFVAFKPKWNMYF